jgi:hypothetical protein
MLRKFGSAILVILIVMGIVATISNFSIKAYASAIWGTTTQETSMYWQLVYYLQGRWLYGNYYCIDEASNCSITN